MPFFCIAMLFLFLEEFVENIFVVVKLVLWDLNFLVSFWLSFVDFRIEGVIRFVFLSSCCPVLSLKLFSQYLIQSLGILSLPFFILLHKIKDIDRIHRKIYHVTCLFLNPLLYGFIQIVCFVLLSLQNVINLLIEFGTCLSLEDETCTELQHLLHFFFGEGFVFLGIFLLLDHDAVQTQFYPLSFHYFLLNSMLSDESVDVDLVFLANSMGSVHSLQIHLRIEIAIIDNNSISSRQIDAQSSGSS